MSRRAVRSIAVVAALGVIAPGCAAGLATVRLVSADKALQEAREAGADAQAAYELTLAERYLAEAVDESMRSQFKDSIELAKKAEAQAVAAFEATKGTRRVDLENAGDDILDEDRTETREEEEDDGRKPGELEDEEFDSLEVEAEDKPVETEGDEDPFGGDEDDIDFEDEEAP